MDAHRFDALTRALSASSRRGLLATLLFLPMVGGLLALLGVDDTTAKGRRKRRKKRHKHGKGNGRHRKGQRNRKCQRKSRARICAGKCGIVKNRKTCQKKVNCGACVCGDVCASGCPFTTIQDAIDAANPGDTIRLCAETYPGTFTIAKNLTLVGAGEGEDGAILDGQQGGSVVTVPAGVTAELQALRITGGSGDAGDDGGGITNSGTLTLSACTVTDNTAGHLGGGIFNEFEATLSLTDCTVSLNTSVLGGGLYNTVEATLNLTNSTVTDNTARNTGGGIINVGTVTFEGTSCVENNQPDDCLDPRDPSFTCPSCTS